MAVKYTSKVWTTEPITIEELIRKLGFTLKAEITPDDFVVKRRGTSDHTFNVLHISWGDRDAVTKYKLFKVDVFEP